MGYELGESREQGADTEQEIEDEPRALAVALDSAASGSDASQRDQGEDRTCDVGHHRLRTPGWSDVGKPQRQFMIWRGFEARRSKRRQQRYRVVDGQLIPLSASPAGAEREAAADDLRGGARTHGGRDGRPAPVDVFGVDFARRG